MPKWTKRASKPLNNLWNSKEQRCWTSWTGWTSQSWQEQPLEHEHSREQEAGSHMGPSRTTFLSISCSLIEIKCMSKRQLVFARATLVACCCSFGGGSDWIKALHHFSWPPSSFCWFILWPRCCRVLRPFPLIMWKFGSNCQQQLALTLLYGP